MLIVDHFFSLPSDTSSNADVPDASNTGMWFFFVLLDKESEGLQTYSFCARNLQSFCYLAYMCVGYSAPIGINELTAVQSCTINVLFGINKIKETSQRMNLR